MAEEVSETPSIPRAEAELALREASLAVEDAELDVRIEKLNARQRMFIEEFLKDLNATHAYIRAGYSPATASVAGNQLLAHPVVKAAIERGKAQRLARIRISQDQVLQEMGLLAESCIDHYEIDDRGNVTLAEGAPDGAMRAVQSVKKKIRHLRDGSVEYDVEIRLWDKPGPLKLMGRHVGLFSDRVELSGKIETQVVCYLPENYRARE